VTGRKRRDGTEGGENERQRAARSHARNTSTGTTGVPAGSGLCRRLSVRAIPPKSFTQSCRASPTETGDDYSRPSRAPCSEATPTTLTNIAVGASLPNNPGSGPRRGRAPPPDQQHGAPAEFRQTEKCETMEISVPCRRNVSSTSHNHPHTTTLAQVSRERPPAHHISRWVNTVPCLRWLC
jgi:hypothetical protein